MSVLLKDGHQWRSTCSMTRAVPAKWLTPGGRSGLYIVSVRSRIRATFLPSLTIWRMAKGRPSTHMLRWTPAEDDVIDAAFGEQIPGFLAVVGDGVAVGDVDGA